MSDFESIHIGHYKMTHLNLPPSMGFQHEEYYNGNWCVPYYTCLVGPFRIYVYHPGGLSAEGWVIERKVDDPKKTHASQFFGVDVVAEPKAMVFHMPIIDPLACMAIINDITSESNNDADPTGADENVLAPHIT